MGIEASRTKTINLNGSENNLLRLMSRLEESSDAREIVANYPNLNDFQRDLAIKSICLGFNCLTKNNAKLILKTIYFKDITYSPAKEIFEEFFNLGKSLKNMNALNHISLAGDTDDMKYLLQINDRDYTVNQKLDINRVKELEEKSDEELLKIIGGNDEKNLTHE